MDEARVTDIIATKGVYIDGDKGGVWGMLWWVVVAIWRQSRVFVTFSAGRQRLLKGLKRELGFLSHVIRNQCPLLPIIGSLVTSSLFIETPDQDHNHNNSGDDRNIGGGKIHLHDIFFTFCNASL